MKNGEKHFELGLASLVISNDVHAHNQVVLEYDEEEFDEATISSYEYIFYICLNFFGCQALPVLGYFDDDVEDEDAANEDFGEYIEDDEKIIFAHLCFFDS